MRSVFGLRWPLSRFSKTGALPFCDFRKEKPLLSALQYAGCAAMEELLQVALEGQAAGPGGARVLDEGEVRECAPELTMMLERSRREGSVCGDRGARPFTAPQVRQF